MLSIVGFFTQVKKSAFAPRAFNIRAYRGILKRLTNDKEFKKIYEHPVAEQLKLKTINRMHHSMFIFLTIFPLLDK